MFMCLTSIFKKISQSKRTFLSVTVSPCTCDCIALRHSPSQNQPHLSLFLQHDECKSWRISSCFFSSQLKMRISSMSLCKKCFKTVLPNEPVPPVMSRVAPLNVDMVFLQIVEYVYKNCSDVYFLVIVTNEI